ncbi:peptide deformylase [Patescibacteria group bacterium]|nr:peptide deformylase [Patescibacteria group bacterium]
MSGLKIRKYGDTILRAKCEEVKEINDEVKDLARKMLRTMHRDDGIGLAAPQVGDKRRIIVVDIGHSPLILINPKIIKKSDKMAKEFEGCLSLPGINLRIKRPQNVEVEGYLLEREQNVHPVKSRETGISPRAKLFNRVKIKAEDLLARDLQHEIDHLDGVLIIDKVPFFKKLKAIKKLKKKLRE